MQFATPLQRGAAIVLYSICEWWTTHTHSRLAHHIQQPPRIALDDLRHPPSGKPACIAAIPQRDVLRSQVNELRFEFDADEMQAVLERVIGASADAGEWIQNCRVFGNPALSGYMRIDALSQ